MDHERTVTQENEMADGMERGGGICDQEAASEGGHAVVGDIAGSIVPFKEALVELARQEAIRRLALSQAQTNRIAMAAGIDAVSSGGM